LTYFEFQIHLNKRAAYAGPAATNLPSTGTVHGVPRTISSAPRQPSPCPGRGAAGYKTAGMRPVHATILLPHSHPPPPRAPFVSAPHFLGSWCRSCRVLFAGPACMEGNAGSLYGRVNRTSTRGFLAYVAAGVTCAAVLACFVLSAADPSLDDTGDVRLGLSSRSPRVWPVSPSLPRPTCCCPCTRILV
jgi:hypothetical protein